MFIPDPNFFHPGSRIRIKGFKYCNPKNCFQALGNMILVVHPGSWILIFTHPGSLSKKGTGTLGRRIRTSLILMTLLTKVRYLENGLHQGDRLPRPWRSKDDVRQRSTLPRKNPVEKVSYKSFSRSLH
jgi:hypothetical protein